MSNTPSHSTIVRAAIERLMGAMAGGRPARIETYDPVKQLADVQPLIQRGEIDPATGDRRVDREPVLTSIPVLMLGTARSRVSMDIKPGDTVWLVPCSLSMDLYMVQGGEVDPLDDRRNNIGDCVALPAVFDLAHVPGDASTDGLVLHAPRVRIGSPDADDGVARKSDVQNLQDQINVLAFLLNGHVHSALNAPPTTGTPTGATTMPAPTNVTAPTCSSTVFSE